VGDYLVIAMDGVVISSPVIDSPISQGHAQIMGRFDQSQAARMAALLNTDPLPFTFEVVDP
jgi:preprotein translocase subunit SecD